MQAGTGRGEAAIVPGRDHRDRPLDRLGVAAPARDFDRFSVEVAGEGSEERLAAVVDESGLGRVRPDGDHLVVDPLAVRRLAGGAATVDWEARFRGDVRVCRREGVDRNRRGHPGPYRVARPLVIEWRGPA